MVSFCKYGWLLKFQLHERIIRSNTERCRTYQRSVPSVHSWASAIAIFLLSGFQRGCLSMQERCLGYLEVPECQLALICTWQQKRMARCLTLSSFWSMFKALQSSAWLASLLLAFYPNRFVTNRHFHFWYCRSRRNDGVRSITMRFLLAVWNAAWK